MKRLGIVVVVACLALVPLQAHASTPNEFVEEAVGLLSELLNGREEELAADKDALYALIDEILLPRFDRRLAAGQVLGKHWRTASAEQKDRFTDAFYTTLLRRYADGLLEFEHDRVEILPFRGDATRKYPAVKTIVRLDDGTKVPVNYTLINRDSGWLMFDVSIEGVSYVRNFRAEFASEIRTSSLAQVIDRLEEAAFGAGNE